MVPLILGNPHGVARVLGFPACPGRFTREYGRPRVQPVPCPARRDSHSSSLNLAYSFLVGIR